MVWVVSIPTVRLWTIHLTLYHWISQFCDWKLENSNIRNAFILTKSQSIDTRPFYRWNFKLISFFWYPGQVVGKPTAENPAGLRGIAECFGFPPRNYEDTMFPQSCTSKSILTVHTTPWRWQSLPHQPPSCKTPRNATMTGYLGPTYCFIKWRQDSGYHHGGI